MIADLFVMLFAGFIIGIITAGVIIYKIEEKETQQECDAPRQWFVLYAYRRTHFNNYAPPTQWYKTYEIIECEDTDELKVGALYSRLHKDLLFPNSKDDVEIRILDVHEL